MRARDRAAVRGGDGRLRRQEQLQGQGRLQDASRSGASQRLRSDCRTGCHPGHPARMAAIFPNRNHMKRPDEPTSNPRATAQPLGPAGPRSRRRLAHAAFPAHHREMAGDGLVRDRFGKLHRHRGPAAPLPRPDCRALPDRDARRLPLGRQHGSDRFRVPRQAEGAVQARAREVARRSHLLDRREWRERPRPLPGALYRGRPAPHGVAGEDHPGPTSSSRSCSRTRPPI